MPIEYYSKSKGGAISTIIREVASALTDAGHLVTVVSYIPGPESTPKNVVSLGDFRRRRLAMRLRDRISRRRAVHSYRRSVQAALNEFDTPPELVVVFNDYGTGAWLRRILPDVRIVTWLQNLVEIPANVDLGDLDIVGACSTFIRDATIANGVPAGQCHVVPSGVNLAAFRPRPDWLAPRATLRVLCVGRLDPNKGHDVGVAAVARLQETSPVDIELAGARWWYGDELDPYSKGLIESLERVGGRYLGLVNRDEIAEVFADNDVCLVLSRSEEPFGLVALEAMAAGLAVVATERGGLPEACGGAALRLTAVDDVEAVVDALRSVSGIEGHEELVRVKRASRDRAEQASWAATAQRLLEVCELG
jgi:glycosyltransferase involved in cell wall biosynthesis